MAGKEFIPKSGVAVARQASKWLLPDRGLESREQSEAEVYNETLLLSLNRSPGDAAGNQ